MEDNPQTHPEIKQREGPMSVNVEVSWGELIDKVTILQIKLEMIPDAEKVANVRRELEALEAAHRAAMDSAPGLCELEAELKAINGELWSNEDRIRELERVKDFGDEFIACARNAYRMNDQRATVKRTINALLGSRLVEEKSYADYV